MTRSLGFWNFMAKRYARSPVKDQAAYQRKLDNTASYLQPDWRVLEIGCGTGTTALYHSSSVARIDAIDFSPNMIDIAREKAKTQGVNSVNFVASTIDAWPIPKEPYDAVLAMSILHLVPDLDAALAKIKASLAPNGMFFSSTACLGEAGGILPHVLPIVGALRLIPNVQRLTIDTLAKRLEQEGFEIEHRMVSEAGTSVYFAARLVG